MIIWVIVGGLLCVLLGVVIGFKYCAYINGIEFQRMFDNGTILIETEDGWEGTREAIESFARKVIRK
jgi:hypothetical protein